MEDGDGERRELMLVAILLVQIGDILVEQPGSLKIRPRLDELRKLLRQKHGQHVV